MKSWKLVTGYVLVALWLSADSALAQHHEEKADQHGMHGQHAKMQESEPKLPLCPVMGEPVDFNVKTMTADGPVYFCCSSCIKKFEKNPEKYSKKAAEQRAALKTMERVQVNCPVSGEPIDGKTFIMSGGKGVAFCCNDCVAKYEKDPAKYAAKLEAGCTYQTRCPVSGEKIDPTAFTDLPTGERIYFCCKGCSEKLLRDPEKYAPKLAEQGVNLDLDKLKAESGREKHASPSGHGHHEGGHDHP